MPSLDTILAGMPLELLALRMVLVALFVILVAVIAERLGPFLGAMVASLPLYTGPVYLMLALEHDAAYIEAATVSSVAICGANPVLVILYALLARTRSVLPSLAAGLSGWLACAAFVQSRDWTLVDALLFVAPIYIVSIWLGRHFTRGIPLRAAGRRWGDLLARAALVAVVAGAVIVASRHVPPQVTGILATIPILMTSIVVVMHPRVGGQAAAALLAHSLAGLAGMVIAFAAVHLTVGMLGLWPALGFGLAITVTWNLLLVLARGLRGRRAGEPSLPPQRASSAPTRSNM